MGHLWQLNDFKDHTFMRELSVYKQNHSTDVFVETLNATS
jgi:hypothetical protein